MILISEFLPNPAGKDADGEWVELFNSGAEPADLSGWALKDVSGKSFSLDGYRIAPSGYLVLDSKTTKIGLNNNGETLFLYQGGDLKDKAEFSGTAGEGTSVVRKINENGIGGEIVFSTTPTPGQKNIFDASPAAEQTGGAGASVSFQSPSPVLADFSAAGSVTVGGSGAFGIFLFAAALAAAVAFLATLLIRKMYRPATQ